MDGETQSTAPEAPSPPSRPRPLWHRAKRRVRGVFSRLLMGLAVFLVPYLYFAYLWFVWHTSRVEDLGITKLRGICAENGGAVALLWHEEVFTVAYVYPHFGLRGHTLANPGAAGRMIARLLKMAGYVVFRGGTKSRRRRSDVLQELIDHMRSRDDVIYGLTVDGSVGPPYRMKRGGIVIARECKKPIVLARTWFRRCIRLGTWDRMAIPLPWNVIRSYLVGPYEVPPEAHTEEGLLAFRRRLEDDLIDLAARSYEEFGQPRPENLVKRGDGEE